VSYCQSTAISYRLSAKIVIFSKGILNDVDTVSERASSSITPQVLMTTKTKRRQSRQPAHAGLRV